MYSIHLSFYIFFRFAIKSFLLLTIVNKSVKFLPPSMSSKQMTIPVINEINVTKQ